MWNWLKTAIEKIVSVITGFWSKLLELVNAVFVWVWDCITYCGQAVWDFFLDEDIGLVWVFVNWLLGCGEWFVGQLPYVGGVLSDYGASFSTAMGIISKVNRFLPVVETGYLIGIFLFFVGLFLLVKLILKLIPSVG